MATFRVLIEADNITQMAEDIAIFMGADTDPDYGGHEVFEAAVVDWLAECLDSIKASAPDYAASHYAAFSSEWDKALKRAQQKAKQARP